MKKIFLLICFALQFKSVVSSHQFVSYDSSGRPLKFVSYDSSGRPLQHPIFKAAQQKPVQNINPSQTGGPYVPPGGTFIPGQKLVSRNPGWQTFPATQGRSRSPSPQPDSQGHYWA